jgi:hypothetical protein
MEEICQLNVLATVPSGKSLQHPLSRRLGGIRSRSGCYGKEKNLLHLPKVVWRFFRVPTPNPVTVPSEPSCRPEAGFFETLLRAPYILGKTVQFNCVKNVQKTELNVLWHSTGFPSSLSVFLSALCVFLCVWLWWIKTRLPFAVCLPHRP